MSFTHLLCVCAKYMCKSDMFSCLRSIVSCKDHIFGPHHVNSETYICLNTYLSVLVKSDSLDQFFHSPRWTTSFTHHNSIQIGCFFDSQEGYMPPMAMAPQMAPPSAPGGGSTVNIRIGAGGWRWEIVNGFLRYEHFQCICANDNDLAATSLGMVNSCGDYPVLWP